MCVRGAVIFGEDEQVVHVAMSFFSQNSCCFCEMTVTNVTTDFFNAV